MPPQFSDRENLMRNMCLKKGAPKAEVRNHEGDDILDHVHKGPMYRSSGDGPFPEEPGKVA